jgi:AraC-like DNA-binding protein
LDLSLWWADRDHQRFHDRHALDLRACGFRSSELLRQTWQDYESDPIAIFVRWGHAYVRGFAACHPRQGAIELRDALDCRYDRRGEVERVARELRVDARVLRREFRALTTMSVLEYQTRRRVEIAARLLATSEDKVQTVARAVGWASRKDLNRAFARFLGVTPTTIRKSVDPRRSSFPARHGG